MVPQSGVSNKKSFTSLSETVCQNNTAGAAQPWSCMTIKFIPVAVNEFDSMHRLVVSISQLSLESSYMSQLMRMSKRASFKV
jgi:hypothetical protein